MNNVFKFIFGGLSLLLSSSMVAAQGGGEAQPTIEIVKESLGNGDEIVHFSNVKVHYTGRLSDGTVFDSSHERKEPIALQVGAGQVIPGWEEALMGMKLGGTRTVKIPPELAYGAQGVPGAIPPNAVLEFDMEVVDVQAPPFATMTPSDLVEAQKSGLLLIDIRRPEEWQETGTVEDAVKLTAFEKNGQLNGEFLESFQELVADEAQSVALICRSGNRTALLANALSQQLGYSKVINVSGGMLQWLKEERPIVKQ